MEWTTSDDRLLLPYNHRTLYPHSLLPVRKKHKRKTPGLQRALDTQYNICGLRFPSSYFCRWIESSCRESKS
jgi:hypothetical protein